MVISDAGLDLVKQFEGLRLEAYVDAVGQPTIGYGHTAGVQLGQHITQAQADQFLRTDLADAEDAVGRLVSVGLSQTQFDALTSFVYNVGAGNFQGSTLLRKLNADDYAGAAAEFGRWTKGGGGQDLPGLVTRRQAERDLFLKSAAPAPGWRLFAPPDRWQRFLTLTDETRRAVEWLAAALGLVHKEDQATRKVFVGLPLAPAASPFKVVPLQQHTPVSCGETSVAMAINALTGEHLEDTDIAARYGFALLAALNAECEPHGYRWSDGKNLVPGSWPTIEAKTAQGLPVVIGLNGPMFSVTGRGHIVLIVSVAGEEVTFADPAHGCFRTCTKTDMNTCPPHPDGKFLFWAERS